MLRAKYWIGVGAQPTDTMWRLLAMVRLLNSRSITAVDTVMLTLYDLCAGWRYRAQVPQHGTAYGAEPACRYHGGTTHDGGVQVDVINRKPCAVFV